MAERYDPQSIERKWQARWEAEGLYRVDLNGYERVGGEARGSDRTEPAAQTQRIQAALALPGRARVRARAGRA